MSDVYELYRPGGKPTLLPSAVLFLDILGTAVARDGDEAQASLEQTHHAFTQARDWGESKRGANDLTVASWFSDNLVMGMPVTGLLTPANAVDLLAMYAALHQLALSDAGLFARGAITLGLFYADPDFVNGPALNFAYELESRSAVGPRVILAPTAMDALRDGGGEFAVDAYVAAGDDDVPFVDYLRYLPYVTPEGQEGQALERHRDHIRANLGRHRENLFVLQKYAWLASYHDARVPSDLRVRSEQPAAHFRLFDATVSER